MHSPIHHRQPPKGPTPWILRDFIPPVYSWIGNTIELSKRPPSPPPQSQSQEVNVGYISRVAMTQSVMNQGHPWNIYLVESMYKYRYAHHPPHYDDKKEDEDYKNWMRGGGLETKQEQQQDRYYFIASTRPKNGRPPRQLILDILSEWT